MNLHMVIAVGLALMLGLTSQSMALARGNEAVTGQMVLCTGAGPVAVFVDAQGEPTDTPHICPDSALNLVFVLALPNPDRPQRLISARYHTVLPPPVPASALRLLPPSRAPPRMI
ncbi:hypothetical protein ACFSUD_14630 [Sulfitobacter aestuarii]|uniref:DUF2946 domain-containing protein n=1 Tax=Sulfitobacter aestuarii TaxID=2161676 RepID=A0ABW5U6I2_9RHOB